jgi:hypothetical protein
MFVLKITISNVETVAVLTTITKKRKTKSSKRVILMDSLRRKQTQRSKGMKKPISKFKEALKQKQNSSHKILVID